MIRSPPNETIKLTNGLCQTIWPAVAKAVLLTHTFTHLEASNEKCLDAALSRFWNVFPTAEI